MMELCGRVLPGATWKKNSTKDGGEFVGPCPACGGHEKRDADRFHLWPMRPAGSRVYWCRSCGKSGDLIQFRRDFMGETFKEAAAACGKDTSGYRKRLGAVGTAVRRPAAPGGASFVPASYPLPGAVWLEKADKLVRWANERLLAPEGAHKLEWLAARGIDRAAAARFLLGWLPETMFRPRAAWGLPKEMKEGREKKLWIPAGVVVPLVIDGVVWRIRIRRDDMRQEDKNRYIALEGSSMRTSVIAGDPRAAVVVESELDAYAVAAAVDGRATVVSTGSASIRPDVQAHRVLSGCLRILVALDRDKAGREGAAKWRELYPDTARRWPVPDKKDPGDVVAAGVDLAAWVWGGLPPALTVAGGGSGPCVSFCSDEGVGGFEESGKRKAEGEVENGEDSAGSAGTAATGASGAGRDGGGAGSAARDAAAAGGPVGGPEVAAAPMDAGGDGDALRGAVAGDRGAEDMTTRGDAGAAPVAVGDVLPVVTGVLALARLMAGCPVRVRVDRRAFVLVQDDKWMRKNWQRSREISQMVFGSPDVSGYLMGLPDGVYSATDLVRLERSAGVEKVIVRG